MYTFDMHLWVTDRGEYRVKDRDRIVMGGRRIGSLGKVAAKFRTLRDQRLETKFWAGLPDLPAEIAEAIKRIAAYQDGWAERQQERDAEEERIAKIGRWDD